MKMIMKGREIEFRGESLNTGKWIYSSVIANGTIKRKRYNTYMLQDEWIEVIPETVGQYTGLKDKSITPYLKIYGGDIVKYSRYYYEDMGQERWENGVGVIKYNEFQARYIIDPIDGNFEPGLCTDWKNGEKTSVIGNTTDNPELLKG